MTGGGKSMTVATTAKIPAIQHLRAVAILAVMLCHTVLLAELIRCAKVPFNFLSMRYGVELFFVISGFVVTKTLSEGGFNVGAFYIRRVFRLFPALLVTCILTLVAIYFLRWAVGYPVERVWWETGLTLTGLYPVYLALILENMISGPPGAIYGHMWSLGIEEQFYLVLGLLTISLSALKFRQHLFVVLGVICAAMLLLLSTLRINLEVTAAWPSVMVLKYMLSNKMEYLFAGALIYICFDWIKPVLERLPLRNAILMGAAVFPFIVIGLSDYGGTDLGRHGHWAVEPVTLVGFSLAVAIGAIDARIAPRSSIYNRIMLYVGDRSYVIYLIHILIAQMGGATVGFMAPSIYNIPLAYGMFIFFFTFPLTIGVADIISRWIEKPVNDIGHMLSWRYMGYATPHASAVGAADEVCALKLIHTRDAAAPR